MLQILAVSSINLILLDLGMVLALPTIVIPELLKSSDGLKFTEEQASWFGMRLLNTKLKRCKTPAKLIKTKN